MAIDPIHALQLTAGPPADVAHLGVVPDHQVADRVHDETEELRRRLETERSAGRALLAALGDLEARLATERAAVQALLSRERDLDAALEAQGGELRSQRDANAQLWSQVIDLNGALVLAQRRWWRRMLDRPPRRR